MPANFRDAFARLGVPPPPAEEGVESSDPDRLEQLAPALIRPGLVVLDLDPVMLLEEPGTVCTANPATRSGPFVCVGTLGSHSVWAGLTTKWRVERLEIPAHWRMGGPSGWRERRQFLTDGATLYKGPSEAFAAASWREVFTAEDELPRLTPTGLDAVIKRIEAARGRRKKARRRERRRTAAFQESISGGGPPAAGPAEGPERER